MKLCPHCGAKMVEYKHGLSKGLVRALIKAYHASDERREFNIAECGLSYSERENLRKLKYWGLIEKLGDPEGKGGMWCVTIWGSLFLRGEIAAPKSVITYRGSVVEFEGPEIRVDEVTDGWKWKPDYVAEARPA